MGGTPVVQSFYCNIVGVEKTSEWLPYSLLCMVKTQIGRAQSNGEMEVKVHETPGVQSRRLLVPIIPTESPDHTPL
jgi:hypothetical protein